MEGVLVLLPFPFTPSPFPSASFPSLRSRTLLIQLEGLGSALSPPPSGVWGRAPVEIEIWCILASKYDIWWQQFLLAIVFVQLLSSKSAHLSQWRGLNPPTPLWLRHCLFCLKLLVIGLPTLGKWNSVRRDWDAVVVEEVGNGEGVSPSPAD